jgi:hypothetical protein
LVDGHHHATEHMRGSSLPLAVKRPISNSPTHRQRRTFLKRSISSDHMVTKAEFNEAVEKLDNRLTGVESKILTRYPRCRGPNRPEDPAPIPAPNDDGEGQRVENSHIFAWTRPPRVMEALR